jgi:SAM-dependent methyltransferase
MTTEIEDAIRSFYKHRLKEFGATAKGVDYPNQQRHWISFSQIVKIFERETSLFSVLDFGCGYGELISYLRQTQISQPWFPLLRYTGVDLSPEMIERANFMNGNFGQFHVGTEVSSTFDYVVVNGTLNLRLGTSIEDWTDYCLQTLKRLKKHCTRGLVVTLLSNVRDSFEPGDRVYYADPPEWLNLCLEHLSKKVAILHDYGVPEFALLLRF